MSRFKDRPVLITGCSSGIGNQAAHTLRQRGYRVIASARDPADVARLQRQGFFSVSLDLADSTSIEHGLEQALEHTSGRLYGLFNNGAYGQPGAVEDLSRDALRAQFETNLFGWVELTNRVIPIMRRQNSGRIIQNSSVLGLVALPFRGAYIASKFALEGISDTLRMELSGTGIFVSLVEPGPIESRFRANALIALERWVNIESSAHPDAYTSTLRRLKQQGHAAPFTLPAQAVVKKLLLALESTTPRPRYYVTYPTYLLGALRRLLSSRMLDRLMLRLSRNE